MELLALAEGGRIACHVERHPLSQVDAVFDKLRRDEIIGRAVIVPDGH
jgi:alcohol dehydrogenase, propanol-preferring